MTVPILSVEIRIEHDVVLTRQRARQLAALFGFDTLDQTRIATAVSEIARNAYRYAGRATAFFLVEQAPPPSFVVRIEDLGPGISNVKAILDGQFSSRTGNGAGICGAKRLMDQLTITSSPATGTTVVLGKLLPRDDKGLDPERLTHIIEELARRASQNPFEELQVQNQELLHALDLLRAKEGELARLNRELDETNRGVVALYSELDEKAAALQRASDLKTRFLSNMSHEFRTPLSSIVSLAGILLDGLDGELGDEQRTQVELIRRSAESLSGLVNDLLDLAKIEAGKTDVHPSALSMVDLFTALRGMFRPIMPNRPVALTFADVSGLPMLYQDEAKLSQVLRNFISNALKFTRQGEVTVSATLLDATEVVVEVRDTGIGIPDADMTRIFDEYEQVDGTDQRAVKGTGLGLPLSRKLAELLGGDVSAESEVGAGSTFKLRVPLVYSGAEPG